MVTTDKALISKIQRYSTKDGPGIRSTVFFVGCNMQCKWCSNPELMDSGKKLMYFADRCQLCGRCVAQLNDDSLLLENDKLLINRERIKDFEELAASCFNNAFEVIGKEMTVEDLSEVLLKDKDFYTISGGGVTFSGGEALLNGDYLYQCCKLLKDKDIHICLDTAGLIATDTLLKVAHQTDLVLLDIKAFASDIHQKCTGVDNQLILTNARALAENGVKMIIRLVIVPEYNADIADISERLRFIKGLGDCVLEVNILPYHNYGKGKYQRLQIDYPLKEIPLADDLLEEVKTLGSKMGLNMKIYQ